ncbi:DnaJ domain-containing protein [Paracrocinitomix mangrovi]|uniref:J domain-containing protein n=1 Tax=Paracrocinitomix mangrovi TaxID=2862509 RepID=UPI001C8D7D18|nr:DnaJ domain-containing protein [Paracrocinitomix mangrovi]UKN01458.1 DnaJ domain-containing protein [Paracrocinitomix mangrovi]
MIGKEKYFRVLGINPTNDQGAIKRAYRKQALKYHPDRNDSADAHYQFIKITEAYEVLTGQRKVKSNHTTYKPKTKEEIFAEKVALAKERWRQYQAKEEKKDKEYYRKIAFGWTWRVFQFFAVYSALWSTLLICDYFLDGQHKSIPAGDDRVILDYRDRIVSLNKEMFHVDNEDFWIEGRGYRPIRTEYSYLFNDMRTISVLAEPMPPFNPDSHSNRRMHKYENFINKEVYQTTSVNSVYGAFPILHIIFFVPLILIIFKRPNLRFSLWRLLSIWVIFPTIVFFTFNNNRIFNLFDLIFE